MEPRGPAAHDSFGNTRGRGEMIKAPIKLQDLRRRIYVKAKAEPSWRFSAEVSAGSGGVGDGCTRSLNSSMSTKVKRYKPASKAAPA